MGRPVKSHGRTSSRPRIKPARRNSAARLARAKQARLAARVQAQRGLPVKAAWQSRVAATAGRLWREDRPWVAFFAIFFVATGYLAANQALVPPTLAELIAKVPSITVQARGDAGALDDAQGGSRGVAHDVTPDHSGQPVRLADAVDRSVISDRSGIAAGGDDGAEGAVRAQSGASREAPAAIALLTPVGPELETQTMRPDDQIAALDQDMSDVIDRVRACSVEEAQRGFSLGGAIGTGRPPLLAFGTLADDPAFGSKLAAAAEAQTGDFVVYTDKYRQISYPMGDVATLYGVCTDVVIRAYRALGIDLQAAVKSARVGSGDASIDHRRVEVLRRFFKRTGSELPPSDFAEDYLPGDIVTYYRPQNSGSQYHIAIVSNRVSRSGRPMIVHNRGWGPQIEDALFVNEVTGHYRYSGQSLVAGAGRVLPKLKIIGKKGHGRKREIEARAAAPTFRTPINKLIAVRSAERRSAAKP